MTVQPTVLSTWGGGYGELIASILCEPTGLRGILFDLAHATAAACSRLAAAGVEERCALVTGSFFDTIPGAADAYLLKSVLHDWDDDQAVTILDNCRRVMEPNAKLFVIERIAPQHFCDSPRDQRVARSDLNMLVSTGGRERTEAQYRELLGAARLRVTRLLPLGDPYCVIESRPDKCSVASILNFVSGFHSRAGPHSSRGTTMNSRTVIVELRNDDLESLLR